MSSLLDSDSIVEMNDIYESILDLNQDNKRHQATTKIPRNISSPKSHDSGIHSDERLTRHNSNNHTNLTRNNASCEDSLYSSIISSDHLTRELSVNSKLNEEEANYIQNEEAFNETSYKEDADEEVIHHLDQCDLPLGWVKCCGKTWKVN